VLPTTISRFRSGGDNETANLLERVVYPEEITHCAAGVKWFKYLCLRAENPTWDQGSMASPGGSGESEKTLEENEAIQKFHSIVRTYLSMRKQEKLLGLALSGMNHLLSKRLALEWKQYCN
jgi:hypothetical protein